MTAALKNFVGGEWVDGSGLTRNINPSNTKDVVGEYAKADKAQTEKAIAAAKAAFPAWARSTPQERYDALNKISARNSRPQGRTRPPARPRGRQDPARRYRRGRARRTDLHVLRRRGAAPDRREGRVRAARPRRRDHPRADRRRRPDHAVEFPDRHSRLEDRAGARLRQHRRVQAGRPGARLGAALCRDHRALRAFRPASSTS